MGQRGVLISTVVCSIDGLLYNCQCSLKIRQTLVLIEETHFKRQWSPFHATIMAEPINPIPSKYLDKLDPQFIEVYNKHAGRTPFPYLVVNQNANDMFYQPTDSARTK